MKVFFMNKTWLNFLDRKASFKKVESRIFDLVVIGGGITGAGIARDAAMRGLDVALVEARDFASGTSSRSSKMIHGGLRYLAQGNIALVREAANERAILRSIAPHFTQPMPFVIPAASKIEIAKLKTALWTFEKLANVTKSDQHKIWSLKEIKENEPLIRADKLSGALIYTEYLTDDARLTLANVRSAQEAGATILSYASVKHIIMEDNKAKGVEVVGALPGENMSARIHAKLIVNAAGPWVDAIRLLENHSAHERLQLTKGIHVVLPKSILPISRTVIITTEDNRSIFAVPKEDYVYLGTTDTFYGAATYWPEITRADVNYLFAAVIKNFNIEPLKHEDIVSVWAGLRPLIAEEGKQPTDISRKDEIWTGAGGILSIAGGKLTAYRKMAERVVSNVEQLLGRRPTPCTTDKKTLPGGDIDTSNLHENTAFEKLKRSDRKQLISQYGSEAINIARANNRLHAEVTQAVQVEGALTLEDYWMRRSSRALFDYGAGLPILSEAANIMGDFYNWSESRRDSEIKICESIHNKNLANIGVL